MNRWTLVLGFVLLVATACGDDDSDSQSCALADLDACGDGRVCQPTGDGGGECVDQCDPLASDACEEGLVCEARADGRRACFHPVYIRGRVFDLTDDSAIEGARVSAADDTGAAATDVVITGSDGTYSLTVPVQREPDGTPSHGIFTLRVAAQDYEPFPHGVRPALPLDAVADSTQSGSDWVVDNAATDVGLIPLPEEQQGLGSIAGSIVAGEPGGVMVVAEGGTGAAPVAWSDLSGDYRIFNVAAGTYDVAGYKAGIQFEDRDPVTLTDGQHATGIDLSEADGAALATVSGSVNIVNGGTCGGTSVVLVPESTFNAALARGEPAPGLRAPDPGTPPSITGAFSIADVPDGQYVVLAAFENDHCVRDPDPGIAGTQIVHITVDAATATTVAMPDSFKVTGAVDIVFPGAEAPEEITGAPTFEWVDDSSEEWYVLVVYDAFGNEVWRNDNAAPGWSGGNVTVPYAGTTTLEPGMYYQFRATSTRSRGPISMTEDLLGVFYLATP